MDEIIKCRFCNWKVARWSYNKKKKRPLNNAYRLVDHVMIHHPEEYEQIQDRLEESQEAGG